MSRLTRESPPLRPEFQNLLFLIICPYCAKPVMTWPITMKEAEEASFPHGQEVREAKHCFTLPCEGIPGIQDISFPTS